LFAAIRYVENNPVRAGVVDSPDEYRWSSVRGHINRNSDPILSQDCPLVKEIRDWLDYLKEEDDKVMIDKIRSSTRTGRPCGDDDFMSKKEGLLGRQLKALPRGRSFKKQMVAVPI